jgi:nucleoid-associated protein YgaU
MGRYQDTKRLINASDYYSFLRKKRNDKKRIIQYATPKLINPGVAARASLMTNAYIWKYGDRFYQMAHQYYGDSRLWWIIAWYNGTPTEADIFPGDQISIPINASKVLEVLGL